MLQPAEVVVDVGEVGVVRAEDPFGDVQRPPAALRWAVQDDRAETVQRLLVALAKYWEVSGAIGEGLDWSAKIMGPAGGESSDRKGDGEDGGSATRQCAH